MKTRTAIIVWVMLAMMYGCIRDEVLLPPVLDTPETIMHSNKLVTLTGDHFDPNSLQLFINDTIVPINSSQLKELKFIVPEVNVAAEATLYVKTQFGSSSTYTVTFLPPGARLKSVHPPQAGVLEQIRIYGTYLNSTESIVFESGNDLYDTVPVIKTDQYVELVIPARIPIGAAGIKVVPQDDNADPLPFNIIPAPRNIILDPAKSGRGSIIRIRGEFLDYLEYVLFGKDTAEVLTATNEAIEVRVPENATADFVYVKTNGGMTKSEVKFALTESPAIVSLDKYRAKISEEINVTGTFLEDVFEVKFVDVPATIISQTATTIKTRVPERARSGKIVLTGPGGTKESEFDFEVVDAPVISSFSPASGVAGTKLTINGLHLSGVDVVKLGLTELKIIEGTRTDNLIEAEVTVGASTNALYVSGPGGSFETSEVFTITGGIEITSVTPASGSFNTIVTLEGKNFPPNAVVKFSPDIDAIPSFITSSKIVCQVPVGAMSGKLAVGTALSTDAFKVVAKPFVESITPMKGAIGKEIVIKGAWLSESVATFSNGKTATKLSNSSDTVLVVKVPGGAVTGKIEISSEGGTVVSNSDFEIISPPTITSISPASGLPGSIVVIKGTNLQHNPVVQFAGPATAKVTSINSDELLVEVPVGAAPAGKVTVRTDAVSIAVASAQSFIVIGKPVIQEISPASGTINERVRIRGTNLSNLEAINFDGQPGTILGSPTDTEMFVRVPQTLNATSTRAINVQVKTMADYSGNMSFLLLGTPVITKISPDNNPHGWAFLIEGRNLQSVRRLTVGGHVPGKGVGGIERKAFNYITTTVPDAAAIGDNEILLYHTQDDFQPIPGSYKVLSQPPPGVFPPATIVVPPPLPSNYFQTDISDYWIDANYKHNYPDSALSCFHFRDTFVGEPEDTFCELRKFLAIKRPDDGIWYNDDLRAGDGSFKMGTVELSFPGYGEVTPLHLKGRVTDQAADSILFIDQQTGRQMILVPGKNNGCFKAYQAPGSCEN